MIDRGLATLSSGEQMCDHMQYNCQLDVRRHMTDLASHC